MQTININEKVIFLPTIYGAEKIKINSIVRIEAISNYSKLFFADGKTVVVAKVLRWFEEQISYEFFIRIHRTHFVNKSFMQQYNNAGKVKLFSGEYIDVSRRRKKQFLEYWRAVA
jgi:two-component system, LytTR family, response regulator